MTAAVTVRERPILFTGAMVRAILEDKKTQTRRVVKPQWQLLPLDNPDYRREAIEKCPYGHPGDRLWVREAWGIVLMRNLTRPAPLREETVYRVGRMVSVVTSTTPLTTQPEWADDFPPPKWRPSIHMPRWASRLTLEITAVRVERLQSITEADAIAEGVTCAQDSAKCGIAREHYHDLWDSLNEKRGFGWDANPWVWVIKFAKVTP